MRVLKSKIWYKIKRRRVEMVLLLQYYPHSTWIPPFSSFGMMNIEEADTGMFAHSHFSIKNFKFRDFTWGWILVLPLAGEIVLAPQSAREGVSPGGWIIPTSLLNWTWIKWKFSPVQTAGTNGHSFSYYCLR